MNTGQLFIGAGEVGRDGLAPVSEDDLARNTNRNIIPRFFTRHEKTSEGSFIEKEYLELLVPGDPKSSPVHLVDDRLRNRYSHSYKAFKENREVPTDGTPIEAWLGAANESLVLALKSLHLRTVEHVAQMSDGVLASVGIGARELRKRAQAFLEVQKSASTADVINSQATEIEELKARLARLEKGEEGEDEEQETEGDDEPEAIKIEMKQVKKNKDIWAVMIDGIMDGEPGPKKQIERRFKELKETNQ